MTHPGNLPDSTELSAELLRQTGNRELAEIMSVVGKQATAKADLEFHQGRVIAWDSTDGTNQIWVLGSIQQDVPTLVNGDNVLLFEGDTVAVLRYKYNYFVLGRIQVPGVTRAFGIRSAITSPAIAVSNTSFTTSVVDPIIEDVQIGSSGRALVIVRAVINVTGGTGIIGLQVSNDDGLYFTGYEMASYSNTSETVSAQSTLSGVILLSQETGLFLEPGNNSLGMVYRVNDIGAAGVTCTIGSRQIIVTPY